jgi:hypothetical protein
MASGRQIGEENLMTFRTWAATRTHADFRAMAMRGVLSRTEIAKECGFAKSALTQNPQIRESLANLEQQLRDADVLPRIVLPETPAASSQQASRPVSASTSARDVGRLNRLEQENASLRAEVSELKRQLAKFAILRDALADSGRLPR